MTHYRLVDWSTQGYLLFVALVVLAFHNARLPAWPWLVAAHAAAMLLIHALIRWNARPQAPAFVRLLRDYYPILLYTAFFRETEPVNQLLGAARLDPELIRLEHALFGGQPSVGFMPAVPHLAVSELFYAAYFSFYLMIAGVGLWLALRDARAFRHFITVVSLVFYVCYATYLFVPVVGPRVFFVKSPERELFIQLYGTAPAAVPANLQGGPFFAVMRFIYQHFEAWSAAFPSSHVAIAVTTAWFSWRYLRPIRWLHAGATVMLCVATVYCRYHYVVDVLAGLAVAVVLLPLANWLHRRFGQRDR